MSVIKEIAPYLHQFVYEFIGEERVHELGGEFLGTPYIPSNPFFDTIDGVVHRNDLFIAWLWFDYKFKNKSMIEHFYDQKADGLKKDTSQHLSQLVTTRIMGIFQIGTVKPGNIECIDLRSGVHYHVREYSLASQVHTGDVAILRLCQQADHWEIIMPNGSITPIEIVDKMLAEVFAGQYPRNITIKDTMAYKYLVESLGISKKNDFTPAAETFEQMPKKDAHKLLADAMFASGVYRYISVDAIAEILEKEYRAKRLPMSPPMGARLLMGLVNVDKPGDTENLSAAVLAYWNSLIPSKKLKARKKQGGELKVSLLNMGRWMDDAQLADKAIQDNDPHTAIEVYESLFGHLLEDRTTSASLYRLLTNAANTYLVAGYLQMGTEILEEAEAMCPGYDFAKKVRSLVDSGYYKPLSKEHDQLYSSQVFDYLDWFYELGIDLSMGDGQKTRLTASLDSKVGPNEPCICGALRPNGLPMKYKNCHGK